MSSEPSQHNGKDPPRQLEGRFSGRGARVVAKLITSLEAGSAWERSRRDCGSGPPLHAFAIVLPRAAPLGMP